MITFTENLLHTWARPPHIEEPRALTHLTITLLPLLLLSHFYLFPLPPHKKVEAGIIGKPLLSPQNESHPQPSPSLTSHSISRIFGRPCQRFLGKPLRPAKHTCALEQPF